MRAKQIVTLVILFALLGGTLPAFGAAKAQMADVDKIVTDMMQLYDIPGVSLALVKDKDRFFIRRAMARQTPLQAQRSRRILSSRSGQSPSR